MNTSEPRREDATDQRTSSAPSIKTNPYSVGPPITDGRRFFGRQAELSRILGAVANNHFLVIGERRIGKTSLLRQVEIHLKDLGADHPDYRFWPVYCTLQGLPPERFYVALMRAMIRQTQSDLALSRSNKTYDDFDFEEDLRDLIAELSAKAAPRQPRLVVCLDEVDTLMAYPLAFREQLRALVQALEPTVRLVAAGVIAIEQEALRTSPFYNQFARIELHPLSKAEVKALIHQTAGELYHFTDQAVDLIYQKSHGLPAEVQRMCHHAVNLVRDQPLPRVDRPQTELAFEYALTDHEPEFKLIWWGGQTEEVDPPLPPFNKAQRDALLESLAAGGVVPRDFYERENALFDHRQLDNLTYPSPDGLRLTDLFATWMRRNIILTPTQHVLVIEDDLDVANLLRVYLRSQGYQVSTARNSATAMRIIQQVMPDIILLDIMLPDRDGYWLFGYLEKNPRTKHIPIIFVTQKDERHDKLFGLELGAVDYITKPFDIEELTLRVRNVLQRASSKTLVNPVTMLPSEPLAEERLIALLQQKNWALLSISIQNLQELGESYGFAIRNILLQRVALALQNLVKTLDQDDSFIGHLSETNLIVVSTPPNIQSLQDKIANLKLDFEDLGQAPGLPIKILLSVGVISPQDGPFESPTDIKEAALSAQKDTWEI